MDKDVVYIYNGILVIKRNEIGSFAERWMDLESVIQSEVKSEREKQILCINIYMWNLEKWYGWTYFQGRNRDIDIENGHVDTAVAGGMNWEIGIDIYTLSL